MSCVRDIASAKSVCQRALNASPPLRVNACFPKTITNGFHFAAPTKPALL